MDSSARSRLSNDPRLEARFWDVMGLYLDPPEKFIVLRCDEKDADPK